MVWAISRPEILMYIMLIIVLSMKSNAHNQKKMSPTFKIIFSLIDEIIHNKKMSPTFKIVFSFSSSNRFQYKNLKCHLEM